MEKLSYLSLNEAVDLYCNRDNSSDNSRKNCVKGLRWNFGVYSAYTWDALYSVRRIVSFMENPRLIQSLKVAILTEIIEMRESGAIAAF